MQKIYGKRIGELFDGELISPDFAGYEFEIKGGSDLQGFPMVKTVVSDKRVRMLMSKGMKGYKCKRDGMKKRKSIRGCIVSHDISVLCLTVVKKGNKEIEGVTDVENSVSHWPKRFNKLKLKAGFAIDSNVTFEEVKATIRKAVLDHNNGDKRMLPKLKVQRYISDKIIERREKRKEQSELRKQRSNKIKQEFLKKYPEWETRQNHEIK